MPGFNRTGPEGKGSQTGRRMGKCNPNNQISTEQTDAKEFPEGQARGLGQKPGRGNGLGRGRGRGLGRRFGGSNS